MADCHSYYKFYALLHEQREQKKHARGISIKTVGGQKQRTDCNMHQCVTEREILCCVTFPSSKKCSEVTMHVCNVKFAH